MHKFDEKIVHYQITIDVTQSKNYQHDGHSYVTRSPIYILIENFKVLLPSLEGGG